MTAWRHAEDVMGMIVSFEVLDPVPDDGVLGEAVGCLHDVDATFSTYRWDSPINRLGRGELGLVAAGDDVRTVLGRCLELSASTDGAFDAFGLTERCGSWLDPSGYVKGWSIERAAAILDGGGAKNLSINAGGDVLLRGVPGGRSSWRVGIRHPNDPNQLATVLHVPGPAGVATSATYERGAHIIEPATSQPTTELASATVIGPDLGTADAYATAVFVMGLDGLDWIEAQDGYDALVITHDDVMAWSSPVADLMDGEVLRGAHPGHPPPRRVVTIDAREQLGAGAPR